MTYAARAVPWRAATGAGILLVGLLAALSLRVTRLWPMEGCALGLLAGAAAWCFDEPAAEVVDVAPRSLAWRTLARASGVAWLVLWWVLAVWLVRGALRGHAVAVSWHGAAGALLVTAVVTWRRAAHAAQPGTATAAVVISTAVFLALARPYPRQLPLFPYVYGGPWAAATLWWASTALVGVIVLVFVLEGRGGDALSRPVTGRLLTLFSHQKRATVERDAAPADREPDDRDPRRGSPRSQQQPQQEGTPS
jgi:hypothetical protein